MRVELSYEEALRNWPEKVSEVLKRQKKGKSKHRNVIPEELNLGLSYSELIEGMSFAELLQGKTKTQKPRIERISVCLEASKERACWSSECYEPVTKELFSFIEKKEKELQEKSKKDDELDGKTTEELISELQKYGGFSMFGFDPQTGGYKKVDKI